MTDSPTFIDVDMWDGSTTPVRLFEPEEPNGSEQHPCPLVIIWPGWAMGARYYDPIARELANRGYVAAIGELHGQGGSTAVASKTSNWGYHDAASEDYPQTIRGVKRHLGLPKGFPTVMLTHSMGGQMGSLFLARDVADELGVHGMFGVGSGTPYYKGFQGKTRLELFVGSFIMRWIAKAVGYQPEGLLDVAGYGRQAKNHVVEWTHYARTNRLENLNGADMNYMQALNDVTVPVKLTRFSNDDDCTLQSAQNMADAMPNAPTEVYEYPPAVGELGHNRWAREPKVVSDQFEAWLEEQILPRLS